jgi:GNAT superfamily N-acetyltransferase
VSGAREIVDGYYSIRLGIGLADLRPGQVAVAASDHTTFAERGYGFVRLLWALHLGERAAISVHPAALAEVSRLALRVGPDDVLTDEFCERACAALRSSLEEPGLKAGALGIAFYHPGEARIVESDGEIRPAIAEGKERWAGPREYWAAADHPSAARGEAFSLWLGEQVVAEIMTHEPSVSEMAHSIAEDGIEVAEGFRGRGYGKALLSYWTREMQKRGRVCVHSTSASNTASVGLARSVGYTEYGRSRSVTHKLSGRD